MASSEVYVGQRRSYSGALCTVRYQGSLPSLKGEWLGVEWDDPTRGKHDGSHEGHQIFQCLSPSQTAASFLRPSRKPDPEVTLLEGIKAKYAPSATSKSIDRSADRDNEAIEISGKVVEEVGFDRIKKQLSLLADLKIVLVDELAISGIARRDALRDEVSNAQRELQRTCPNIVELDIGWNTIETWQDVADICLPLKKLRILKASGLRLRSFTAKRLENEENPFQNVEELHLNECLLSPEQILAILAPGESCGFPSLKILSLSLNELDVFARSNQGSEVNCPSVTTMILDNNKFRDLSSLPDIAKLFPNVTSISLQGNEVSQLGLEKVMRFDTVQTLNLAGNKIDSYAFVDALPSLFPGLTFLRISRNPLYERGAQADQAGRQLQPSAATDSTSYYLTLARIPGLKSLNYTTITPRDREEGEIYYLSVAEKEIRALLDADADGRSAEQKAQLARDEHPLYTTLCAKYDREDIVQRFLDSAKTPQSESASRPATKLDVYAPGTLGSLLVDACFYLPESERTFERLLPTTVSVYRLKSLVARQFCLRPLQFRLVYESHEYDPVEPISRSTRNQSGKEEWDVWGEWDVDGGGENDQQTFEHTGEFDDVELSANENGAPRYIVREGQRFRKRETEILDGMREWGDFLDLTAPDGSKRRNVRVRIEPF